ncbi:iron only hydrogenase large subunit domain-containing protein [Colletotrichum costaricense]|uniref:Nuclear architecture-related protein 1 n=1 Tax=Colletotrichum costaricense TaxID=1209916 RepID=A0AAI9Z455_9PEZI|nr:iron only hydrogenase large subunit domain-containing protein [Colletotrichum costaricense]KAK1532629.1 iron only hydrogenase large subunit domain-containing protein [Colletotrichum costaricense]
MSAILSADDLNDFISPGVACIKPIETLPSAPPQPPLDASLEHEVILDGQPGSNTNAAASNAPPAEISLTDCLACSGCVTSAEAVLVSMQSHTEVLNTLDFGPSLRIVGPDPTTGEFRVQGLEDESRMLFVASVSPQTRASLAAAAGDGTTERQAGYMLDALFGGEQGLASGGKHGNGFTWVLDTNVAREACLVLGADEVLGGGSSPAAAAAAAAGASPSPSPSTPATKPILTSSCPGWVCYAEKTHPYVLPHLSRVKSPQALMGTLLKTTLSKKLGIPPSRIWHLAVMPCFDKKLEASREELTDSVWGPDGDGKPGRGVRDVDCVITSKEVLMLAESRGFNFFNLPRAKPPAGVLQRTPFPDARLEKFLFPARGAHRSSVAAGSSGGNLYFTLQTVASKHPNSQIQVIRGRNADVVEFVVASATGDPIFKAARYYGFRNIQNLVRKLKPARPSRMPGGKAFGAARRPTGKSAGLEYAYVEVMACPGGCTNGGGQIKVDDPIVVERKGYESKPGPLEQKDFLAEVDEAYFSAEDSDGEESNGITQNGDGLQVADDVVDGISPSYIRDTLAHWADCTGIDLGRLALTTYREVVSDVGKDKASDTERVVQLAGKIGGGW